MMLSSNCKGKIKEYDLIAFFVFFSLVKVYYIPQALQQGLKIFAISIVLLYMLSKSYKVFVNRMAILAIAYFIPSVIAFLCENMSVKHLLDGALNAICIYMLFTFFELSRRKLYLNRIIRDFLSFSIFANVLSVASVFFVGYREGASATYLFGTKFMTCYLLLFMVAMACCVHYEKISRLFRYRLMMILVLLFEIGVSAWMRCNTGILGGIFFILLFILFEKKNNIILKVFQNPIMCVLGILLPGIIALNLVQVMQIDFVRHIVVDVLGKSAGINGRGYIYSIIIDAIMQHPLFGSGYNCYLIQNITGVGNAQNGLFESLINYGIVGTSFFIVICYQAFSRSKGIDYSFGFKVYFFTMCAISIIEIPYNFLFYIVVFAMYFCKNYIKEKTIEGI